MDTPRTDIAHVAIVCDPTHMRSQHIPRLLEDRGLRAPSWGFVDFSRGYEHGADLDALVAGVIAKRRVHHAGAGTQREGALATTENLTLVVALPWSEEAATCVTLARSSGVQMVVVGTDTDWEAAPEIVKHYVLETIVCTAAEKEAEEAYGHAFQKMFGRFSRPTC